jgi:hypothetical protein
VFTEPLTLARRAARSLQMMLSAHGRAPMTDHCQSIHSECEKLRFFEFSGHAPKNLEHVAIAIATGQLRRCSVTFVS